MGTRSESVGGEGKKKGVVGIGSSNSNFGVGVDGLGLRVPESSSCGNNGKKRMMMVSQAHEPPHHNYYYYQEYQSSVSLPSSPSASPSASPSPCCERSGGFDIGDGGSMFCNKSNQVACMSDIYDVVGAASGSGSGSATNNSAAAVMVSKSLIPSTSIASSADSFFHFDSSASGEIAAASMNVNVNVNLGVAFTAAQLQELERQTLIFKYMASSAPIPSELLLPITKSPSRVTPPQPNLVQGQGSMELRLLSNNTTDPEPWRCRRTDGKKWRCSRDVAPDQKYCERHSHKSRARSRKPVESPAHRINNSNFNNQNVNNLNKSYPKYLHSSISSNEQLQQQPRGLEWFMKGETTALASNSDREWLQNTSKSGDLHSEHLINSDLYAHMRGGDLAFQSQRLHEQYNYLLSPKMVSDQAQTHETRHFIDAWSLGGGNVGNEDGIGSNCFGSLNEKLPLSSLTLSMSGGSETIERNQTSLVGSLGTMGSERESVGTSKPHWMNHVSGVGSTPGGPLAEALCLGIASSGKSDSNTASPHGCSTSTTTSS